jgi:hypothetical protein
MTQTLSSRELTSTTQRAPEFESADFADYTDINKLRQRTHLRSTPQARLESGLVRQPTRGTSALSKRATDWLERFLLFF